jgi:hypothetical protein
VPLLGESVNGPALRVDDVLIAIMTPVLLWQARNAEFFRRQKTVLIVLLLFAGEGVFSALWAVANRATDLLSAMSYAIRPLEYAAFVLVGFLIARRGQLDRLDRCLTRYAVFLAALCVLQVGGVNIGVSQFDFSRAAGNTSGPYEAAVVASFLLFYFASRKRWLVASLPLLSLLLTQSRITTIAAVAIALLVSDVGQRGSRWLAVKVLNAGLAASAAVLIVGLTVGLGVSGPALATRLEQTQVGSSWVEASAIQRVTPAVRTPASYQYFAYDRLVTLGVFLLPDASSVIRFTRWQIELKAWAADPTAIVWGLGPSFAGAATDGFYVRVLVGQGLLGLFLFSVLLTRLWMLRGAFPGLKRYILVLVVTGGVIDIFVSYRPMLLLWLAAGVALGRSWAAGLRADTSSRGSS